MNCEELFETAGLKYSEDLWACYNEELFDGRIMCPFADNDTCTSSELPS